MKNQKILDEVAGLNLAYLRQKQGVKQSDLARQLKISYQQLQKYEAGKNRISAGTLSAISDILDTPLEEFFKVRTTKEWGNNEE